MPHLKIGLTIHPAVVSMEHFFANSHLQYRVWFEEHHYLKTATKENEEYFE